jgi:deoxycytidine triphosphate deaminase
MGNTETNNSTVNTHGDKIPPGMLSSPHIAYCVEKYKIIDNFDESCMGPATYHMRIGGIVRTWENGKKVEFTLGEQDDTTRNIRKRVDLGPNSLTFVTTIEKFSLTKDIIARFNLKSKLVHKGLLLGTGPIVDPQLRGNLLIPLHNFSSQTVTLEYNDELISVEFTKTLNPDDTFEEQSEKYKFILNEHWDFNPDKYWDRIGRSKVESSVSSSFEKYEKSIEDYRQKLNELTEKNKTAFKKYNWIAGLTAGAAIIGLVTLVFTTWQLIESSHAKMDSAYNLIKQYEKEGVDFRALALKKTVEDTFEDIQKQIDELKTNTTDQYNKLDKEWRIIPQKHFVLRESYDEKMKELEGRIFAVENSPLPSKK